MIRLLRFDDEAAEELEAAALWYEARRENLGLEFIAAVRETTNRIREHPATWSLVPGVDVDLPVRRCLLRRFPFAVVYIELETEIRILAVAHGNREPGYWRQRV